MVKLEFRFSGVVLTPAAVGVFINGYLLEDWAVEVVINAHLHAFCAALGLSSAGLCTIPIRTKGKDERGVGYAEALTATCSSFRSRMI